MKVDPAIHCMTEQGDGYIVELDDDTGDVIIELLDGKRIIIRGDEPAELHRKDDMQ